MSKKFYEWIFEQKQKEQFGPITKCSPVGIDPQEAIAYYKKYMEGNNDNHTLPERESSPRLKQGDKQCQEHTRQDQ